jgi:hypothetical protein
MGELFDAIRLEAAKRPNVAKMEDRLAAHLGKEGWKDFEKACLDASFTTSAIWRVIKGNGFDIGYSAIQRIRADVQKRVGA